MKYTLYEVGGKIRDQFLGLNSKDVDYSVVILRETELDWIYSISEQFDRFVTQIKSEGFDVFEQRPSFFTVRAKFPKGHEFEGLVADFVLARKEISYIQGTRQPNVVAGTLKDDLERRDFTVNTLAQEANGTIIDLFNGQKDLMDKVLRTPLDAVVSFNNDPLRILRGFRFKITKGLSFSDEVINAIVLFDADKMAVVSGERIREELHKMFKFDSYKTLALSYWLYEINPRLHYAIFGQDLWLMPTNKK